MSKILFLSIFVLLTLTDKVTAETRLSEEAKILREVDNLEFEIEEGDDDEVELFEEPFWTSSRANKVLVNVDTFGAVGDGVSDDTNVSIVEKFSQLQAY